MLPFASWKPPIEFNPTRKSRPPSRSCATPKSRKGRAYARPLLELLDSRLEFVAQSELHLSRRGERTGQLAEAGASGDLSAGAVRIEPYAVGDVERLSAKLNRVLFVIWHEPALADSEVDIEVARATKCVARS